MKTKKQRGIPCSNMNEFDAVMHGDNMPPHTPTPWNATDDQRGEVIIDATPQYICGVSYWAERRPIEKGWLTQEEAKANAVFIVRAVNARSRHLEALARILALCEKQITNNPMAKTVAPEVHALVMKAMDSYDVQDALAKSEGHNG